MKFIIYLIIALTATSAAAQETSFSDSLLAVSYQAQKDTVIIDSFTFCGLRFSIPRDCNKKSQMNCCSYDPNPPQMACYNGTALFWSYFESDTIAQQNVESIANQIEKQMKSFKKEPVICNLLGTLVKGYRLICTTKENSRWSEIITAGVVNGQPVLVQFHSQKPIRNNKKIQPVFSQIIHLQNE